MRFAVEVARAIRREWPERKPLFFRLSCIDDAEGGWSIEDTLVLVQALRDAGVDLIDCSSGGIGAPPTLKPVARPHGFQVPFAERVRRETGIATMAVGLIREARHAEAILAEQRADLVCIAREALYNPNWGVHAALELLGDEGYDLWPKQYGWWLSRRARNLRLLASEEAAE